MLSKQLIEATNMRINMIEKKLKKAEERPDPKKEEKT